MELDVINILTQSQTVLDLQKCTETNFLPVSNLLYHCSQYKHTKPATEFLHNRMCISSCLLLEKESDFESSLYCNDGFRLIFSKRFCSETQPAVI